MGIVDELFIIQNDSVICITHWNTLELRKWVNYKGISHCKITVHLDEEVNLPKEEFYIIEMLSMKFRGYLSTDGKKIIED